MLRSNWFQTRYLKRNQRKINQAVQTSWYIKKEVWQHMPTLNSYLAWLRFEETTGALKYYWWTIFLDVLLYTNICTLCITIHRHIFLDVLLYTNSLSPTNSQAYLNLQNLQSSPTRQQLTNTALPNRTHVGHPAAPAEEAGDQPTRAGGGGGHKAAAAAAWRADPEGKLEKGGRKK